MTKFTYDKVQEVEREHVASIFLFDGGPQVCLVIKTDEKDKFLWMYEDGDNFISNVGLSGNTGEPPLKKFYRGDSITITF
jgi:hypothetical protein